MEKYRYYVVFSCVRDGERGHGCTEVVRAKPLDTFASVESVAAQIAKEQKLKAS